MIWEIIGLLIEFLFLGIGLYLYLFAIGRLKYSNEENRKKAEAFRTQSGSMIRILALALMAFMVVNIVLHIKDLIS
ncbi:MAG: hypothetical protein MRY78_13810 [Saprospiraceae bacterium]|nr:hypothetical protein [Saprospiraceae bacterium]